MLDSKNVVTYQHLNTFPKKINTRQGYKEQN